MKKIVPVILGPTAVGKTELSLLLAERLPLEVISADSRQIYKYMDIGTAKVAPAVREKVPHHFIDICTPEQTFSAGQFAGQARQTIERIFKTNKLPLVVGGSGLYIRALLDGFFEQHIRDEALRQQLDEELRHKGLPAMYQQLTEVDPVYAQKIDKNDRQRILRALEVFRSSGRPFSAWHRQQSVAAPFAFFQIGLTMERGALYQRINLRVERMMELGLVEEVKNLLNNHYSAELNALNTVGYKEVIKYLKGGFTFSEMTEEIKKNTRRYAKRQMTWFKKDERIRWFEVANIKELLQVRDEILKLLH